jgi:hypothetical protein
MNGAALGSSSGIGSAPSQVAGTGDFNADREGRTLARTGTDRRRATR